jgi:putative Mg2+ transporter-C (MgtC) family protein
MPLLAFSFHTLDESFSRWAASLDWPIEPMLRLVIAAMLGGLVGLEREIHGRQAGFRTNLLLCFGSALVMVTSIAFARQNWAHPTGVNINVDPARVAYGVMGGIGFLGAGAIIKNGSNIRGLTTAAAMWCVAAMGLAAGLGLYMVSIMSSGVILVALFGLDKLEKVLPKLKYRLVTVRRAWSKGVIGQTVAMVKAGGLRVTEANFKRTADLASVDIELTIAFTSTREYFEFEKSLADNPNIELLSSTTQSI